MRLSLPQCAEGRLYIIITFTKTIRYLKSQAFFKSKCEVAHACKETRSRETWLDWIGGDDGDGDQEEDDYDGGDGEDDQDDDDNDDEDDAYAQKTWHMCNWNSIWRMCVISNSI